MSVHLYLFFKPSPEDIFILILRESRRERERQKETSMWKIHIDWLLPTQVLTRARSGEEPVPRYMTLIRIEPRPFLPQADTLSIESNWPGFFMNTLITLYCHSLLSYLPISWNKIHRLVIHLEVGIGSPSLLYPEPWLSNWVFMTIKYFWMNQWVLKVPNLFYFLFFTFTSWMAHMYGIIFHQSVSLLLMRTPFVKSPWLQCWLSPIRKSVYRLRAWLRAGSPNFPLGKNTQKIWAIVIVSYRLVAIWFYGSFKDTCVTKGVICEPQKINKQGICLAVGLLVDISPHRRRAMWACL